LKVEGAKLIKHHFSLLYSKDLQPTVRRGYGFVLAGLIKGT
jgi:hypothetical protein